MTKDLTSLHWIKATLTELVKIAKTQRILYHRKNIKAGVYKRHNLQDNFYLHLRH